MKHALRCENFILSSLFKYGSAVKKAGVIENPSKQDRRDVLQFSYAESRKCGECLMCVEKSAHQRQILCIFLERSTTSK